MGLNIYQCHCDQNSQWFESQTNKINLQVGEKQINVQITVQYQNIHRVF